MRIPDELIPNLIEAFKAARLRMALQRHPSLEKGWSNPALFSSLLNNLEARTGFVVSTFLHGQWVDRDVFCKYLGEDLLAHLLEAEVMVCNSNDQVRTNEFVVKVWRDHFFIEPTPPHYHTANFFFEPADFIGIFPQADPFLTCLKDLVEPEDHRILDINPGCGALSILLAKDLGADISVLVRTRRIRRFIESNVAISGSSAVTLLDDEKAGEGWDVVFELSNWRPGPDHGKFNPYYRHGLEFDFEGSVARVARFKPKKAFVFYESLGNANSLHQYESQRGLAKMLGIRITSHVLRKYSVRDYLREDWVPLNNHLYRLQPADVFQDVANQWADALPDGDDTTIYSRCDQIEFNASRPDLTICPLYNPYAISQISQNANRLLRS